MATQQNSHKHSNKSVTEHDAKIAELNDEIVELRSKVFALRDELHVLRNSRVIGRIIKTRDFIGNPATLPKRAVHKTRRTVAKFVPDRIRLPLMKSLRKTRNGIKMQVHNYRDRSVTVTTVQNAAWPKDRPLVSVVIPYYNRVETIDDTLDSLKTQTFRNFETIIVDDYSNDPASIERLQTIKDARVIHHETNQGVSEARNNGIREAKGKYIICLDSDDMLDPTFIEKATLALESNPDVSLITTYQDMFGVVNELFEKHPYEPLRLIQDNMVITAAEFRRQAWEVSGGYKSDIGYEDWDFWLTLSEHGFWGKLIPEALFKYRTSMQSRYVEDKDVHWNNIKKIRSLHPKYKSTIRTLLAKRQFARSIVDPKTALINMHARAEFSRVGNGKPNVLVTVPWMDFGGVSTILYNFSREVADDVNLHYITGLPNKNEWEYKFKEVSPFVYHMPNMFDEDPTLQLEFVSNYIVTRDITILHIIHNGFIFDMLPELKKRHPKLQVMVTIFNARVPYLDQSVEYQEYIQEFTTDNLAVGRIYKQKLESGRSIRVIPNGINTEKEFNPSEFDREKMRTKLKLDDKDLAVFFIGRLSEEKNPDVFMEVARQNIVAGDKNIRFFVIGDGPMRPEIEKTMYDIRSKQIECLGYQSNVAPYLAAADIFVLPSSIEGFPLSIIEAMSMRVAVIASDVGAVADVIETGRDGFVVKPGSADEILEHVTQLAHDRALLETMKTRSRDKAVKNYSNKILGKNYKNLYSSIS